MTGSRITFSAWIDDNNGYMYLILRCIMVRTYSEEEA